jgi:hypothetical protein
MLRGLSSPMKLYLAAWTTVFTGCLVSRASLGVLRTPTVDFLGPKVGMQSRKAITFESREGSLGAGSAGRSGLKPAEPGR